MLPRVRNCRLVPAGFMVFPEVKGVERSRECSSVGMTLLVADSNSTLTKNQVLSVLQYLGQMRECNALLLDTRKVN